MVFNEIKEAIKDDVVRMIGVWGMPGIGKTTLVKRAAKYAKEEILFEAVAMAVVSQNPNVKAIQGQIADEIGLELTSESERGRAGQLLQCLLARKKILIILDDIWDRIELNDIGIPSASQHKGCKIILTTRKKAVCEEMGTGKNFTIDLLSENEALDLFMRMSGVNDRSSELGRLAEKLSDECGRLPISIVIVARGLVNKPRGSWEDMVSRLHNSDPEEKVFDIINLSYDSLNREEERMFFLLCALFPEDYRIPIQLLFEYGLGLNLFERVDNMDEAAVRAQNLATRLKSQCLLLDEGYNEFVKMHDVVRDVALVIASKGKHVFLVQTQPQLREWQGKMAISLWSDEVKKLPDALECPQLQILMLKCGHRDLQIPDNFFARMKNLVVLDMQGLEFVQIPQSLASLENLRTLRFDGYKLGDISAIGKLQNLVSLSFYGSTIEVLPKEVGQLSNLKFLDFSNCYRLKVIAPGVIQNLYQLEVLHLPHNLGTTILSEFNYLSRLIILDICLPDASMLPDDLLFKNLKKFVVSIGEFQHKRIDIFSSSSLMLKLARVSKNDLAKSGIKMLMTKAHHMELKNVSGISVALPSHLGGYGSLKELIVDSCVDINYILDMSGSEYEQETPSLQLLHLIDLPSLKEISRGKFSSLLFSKLKHLKLYQLPSLVRLWSFQAESNLTAMEVASCHKLEYVFDHDSAKGLSKLKTLTLMNCRNLKAICLSKKQDEDIVFPQLRHLKLLELEKLACFGSNFASGSTLFSAKVNFPILESMYVTGLKSVKKIWQDNGSSECFSQLQVLYVSECDQLEEVFPCHLASNLNCLEVVTINQCLMLGVKDIFQFRATLPKLKNLEFRSNHKPLIHWRESLNRCGGFQSLTSLNLSYCNDLKSLSTQLTMRVLAQLHELSVSNCESMESIIGEENFDKSIEFSMLENLTLNDLPCLASFYSGPCGLDKSIEFSMLKNLTLNDLPRLASFYNGPCGLKFPCLDYLSIRSCPKLKTLASMSRETAEPSCLNFMSEEELFGQQVSFGRLRELRLKRLELIEEIWHRDHPTTTMGELEYLNVKGCDRLLKIFPANLGDGLQNLEALKVVECRALEHVLAVEDHPPVLSNLKYLKLKDLPELKQLWWNKNSRESFGLPSLCCLKINTCPALECIFDASVDNCLENLAILAVKNCSSMVEIVPVKPGRKIDFPLLEGLCLVNLPCLKLKQDVEFPHAEIVIVDRCFNMKERVDETRARFFYFILK